MSTLTNLFAYRTVMLLFKNAAGTKKLVDADDPLPVTQAGSNTTIDALETFQQNPAWSRYSSPVTLVSSSDIGAADDTYVDQGSEIDCRGYKTLSLWITLTVNDSTGNQIQLLSKHESGGADEYVLETSSNYQKTLGNSNIQIKYDFELDNSTPFIQLQSKATDVDTGGGTIATLDVVYTLGY